MSWKSLGHDLGHILATVAKYSAKGALAVSDHPEVIETVASIAGHPEIALAVAQYAPVVSAVKAGIR